MRALHPFRGCSCHNGVLQPVQLLKTQPWRMRSVCAAQRSDSNNSIPVGLRDLYRGLVTPSKQTQKASNGKKAAQGPAKTTTKQKPTGSAAAAGKQFSSKTQPGASSPQEQRKAQNKAAGAKAGQSSSGSKQNKAANKGDTPAAAPQPRMPQSSLMPSNGKGFGYMQSSSKSMKKSSNFATIRSANSDASTATAKDSTRTDRSDSSTLLKVFRFGVDAAAVQKAVDACGWQDRVLQVDVLSQADMLIAVKDSAGGRHQNLKQGERAAHNAGIPFVIVGRRMSKQSLHAALSRYLNPLTPEQAAAQAAHQAKEAEAKAAADAWFLAATTARFSVSPLPIKNAQQQQQQQQQSGRR